MDSRRAGHAGVVVLEATEADVDAFGAFMWRVWRNAGPSAPGFTGATDQLIHDITRPEAVIARIGGPVHRMFLAFDADMVVGFSSTRADSAGDVELSGIIVEESHSGRGIGSRLVGAALATAAGDNHRAVYVKTEVTNDAAISFYEKQGFAPTGEDIENVDGVDVAVCVLTKSLR